MANILRIVRSDEPVTTSRPSTGRWTIGGVEYEASVWTDEAWAKVPDDLKPGAAGRLPGLGWLLIWRASAPKLAVPQPEPVMWRVPKPPPV